MSGVTFSSLYLQFDDHDKDDKDLEHLVNWLQIDEHLAKLITAGCVVRVGDAPALVEDLITPRRRQ